MDNNIRNSMQLERILGFTTNSGHSFISQPNSSNIIYIAGCVVVIVDCRAPDKQKHLYSKSKQNVTSLAISGDGQYLASADCGQKATICIWDLSSYNLISEFAAHDVEVPCMAFSPDNQLLVSVGSQQDQSFSLWDWQNRIMLLNHKLTTPKTRSISFSEDGSYFVTAGDAFVKYWYIQQDDDRGILISSRNGSLGDQRDQSFCDIKCARGAMAGSSYCITRAGLLCELNARRLLHKWVDLRTDAATCLAVGTNLIVVGCANGVSRCFNTTELRFLKNLPKPHKLGSSSLEDKSSLTVEIRYPSTIAIELNEDLALVSCLYEDRSLYIWNISNLSQGVSCVYSALYHSSCIWGLDMYPSNITSTLADTFITCSSDDTLRIWRPPFPTGESSDNGDLLKVVFTDSTLKYLCDLDCREITGATENNNRPLNYDNNEGLRCLKVSPDGQHLAVGSRSGAIKIYDLNNSDDITELKCIAAHDAEVLCLEYSDPHKFDGFYYLASCSRDKLIHIFDAADNYNFLQTIDDHSSSITGLKFINTRPRNDTLQLISCAADRRIIFRTGRHQMTPTGQQQLSFTIDQQIEGNSTFYDMELDSESSCLIAACQDRMVRLFDVSQVKYQQGFKGSPSDSDEDRQALIIRLALDQTCTFLATSCTNKTISIYDYQRGECIGSTGLALSDLVTDLRFTSDGRYLIACLGDGCIFVWSSPIEVANAAKMSQLSMAETASGSQSPLKSLPDWAKRQMLNEIDRNQHEARLESGSRQDSSVASKIKGYKVQEVSRSARRSPPSDGFSQDEQYQAMSRINSQQGQAFSVQAQSRQNQFGGESNLVSSMAKYFQSRENLDKISSHEKFVADSLVHESGVNKGLTTNRSPRLTGSNKQSALVAAHSTKSALIDQTSSRASLSGKFSTDKQQQQATMGGLFRAQSLAGKSIASSRSFSVDARSDRQSEPQDSSDEVDALELAGSPLMEPMEHRARSYRSGSSTMGTGSRFQRSVSPARSCFDRIQTQAAVLNNLLPARPRGERPDWLRLNPASAPINQDLCQHLVDELQCLSRCATRIHQRLQANGDRVLCNLVARGVQNSMDILSIVPPRTLQHHQQQFQSQLNLAASAGMQSSASVISRRRAQSQPRRPSGISSSSSTIGFSTSNQSSSSGPGANQTAPRPSRSRTIQDSSATLATPHHRSSTPSQSIQQPRPAARLTRNNSTLDIDQVLEAYSDRLFKMVQEKMEPHIKGSTLKTPVKASAAVPIQK